MPEAGTIEFHKALADETRFRLYRYLRLSGRPVSVREISVRLGLHPNTLRPHLRRLEEAGLVATDSRKAAGVGRPQTLYLVVEPEGDGLGEYRLLVEILGGLLRGKRALEQARELAGEWGRYLLSQEGPKPGARPRGRGNLAILQEAMARAGFDPRFRRHGKKEVEVLLRDCPGRDLVDEHRELVCAVHRGLIEGMLGGLKPPLSMKGFEPLFERSMCRVVARG